jgi:hypothetical protein
MTEIPIPKCLVDKLQRLNQLAEQYPDSIPLPVVAGFMGFADEGLRAYIDNNPNAFGISWKRMGAVNRAYKIPTIRFYAWYRNGLGL